MTRNIKTWLLTFVAAATLFTSCEDEDSYAEDRKREVKQIRSFLQKGIQVRDADTGDYLINLPGPIKEITEEAFYANDSTTDVAANEFVLFRGSGVYMQIVRKGTGEKLGDGGTVICRYKEYNIAADTLQSSDYALPYAHMPEMMTVTNTLGTFSAQFTSGLMSSLYGAAVPGAWLIPLTFINLGRQTTPEGEIALVRLIVPSTEGQSQAQTQVYPCYYEITYQRGR